MITWIRQLFCKHEYRVDTMCYHSRTTKLKCSRCGKIIVE